MSPTAHGITRWRSIGCSARRCQRRSSRAIWPSCARPHGKNWLALNSQTLQQICDRLYLGWQAFFDGHAKRPPTFKKRRKYRSITFKQTGFKLIGRGRLLIGSRTLDWVTSLSRWNIMRTRLVKSWRNIPDSAVRRAYVRHVGQSINCSSGNEVSRVAPRFGTETKLRP